MQNTNQHIFVVDDDQFHLEIMQQILKEKTEKKILCFESGMACLNEIHLNPDIIFLDHQMDEYNGFETLRKIKRHNPNLFIVMVSAQEEIQTAVDTLKHGAFDYIKKDENLESNISAVIERIETVKSFLKENKSSFLKSILKYI